MYVPTGSIYRNKMTKSSAYWMDTGTKDPADLNTRQETQVPTLNLLEGHVSREKETV